MKELVVKCCIGICFVLAVKSVVRERADAGEAFEYARITNVQTPSLTNNCNVHASIGLSFSFVSVSFMATR